MNFIELCDAVDRLKNDPRVHPNTRVELDFVYDSSPYIDDDNVWQLSTERMSEPLCSISLNGCITLSTEPSRSAVAR